MLDQTPGFDTTSLLLTCPSMVIVLIWLALKLQLLEDTGITSSRLITSLSGLRHLLLYHLRQKCAVFFTEFLFSCHGSPYVLLSNSSLNYTSMFVTELSNLFFTCPTFAERYCLTTNRAVERDKVTLVTFLQKIKSYNPLHWPHYLDSAMLAYCISYHCLIGFLPFKALYGREPTFPQVLSLILTPLGLNLPRSGCALSPIIFFIVDSKKGTFCSNIVFLGSILMPKTRQSEIERCIFIINSMRIYAHLALL